MKVIYIFRPQGRAYSIERVFKPIMEHIKLLGYDVDESHSFSFSSIIKTKIKNIRNYSTLSRKCGCICHITCEVRYCAIFMRRDSTVMTTHDIMSIINPDAPWYARLYAYWIQFYFPMRHLTYLTCISEKTRLELVERFPWVSKKLRVIPNPVDGQFRYTPKDFDSECPTILHIGTKPNKNLHRVIHALKGLKCRLRIVGKLSEDCKHELDNSGLAYSNVFDLSDNDIVKEYENCDILSFPSLSEGFGMPIVEAQSVGRPVLTSDLEPMKSVVGEAGVLVNPENVDDIREGFIRLMNDSGLRERCINSGLNNVKRFGEEEISNQYLKLYQEMERNMSKNYE